MLNREEEIPFGRHKGRMLQDIPDDYLDWIRENLDEEAHFNGWNIGKDWIGLAEEELEYREENDCHVRK